MGSGPCQCHLRTPLAPFDSCSQSCTLHARAAAVGWAAALFPSRSETLCLSKDSYDSGAMDPRRVLYHENSRPVRPSTDGSL